MAGRIFRSTMLAAVFAVLLTAAIIVPSLYNVHESSMRREMRQEADCIALGLELVDDSAEYLGRLSTASRITLISPDGRVLFDNRAEEAQMENHAGRPEVIRALTEGYGESIRTSDTLAETTIYCALRTGDGSVLRIADTRSSMLGTFLDVLAPVAAMLLGLVLLSLVIARKSARRIVAPINALNLDHPLENDAYDELAPLLTRMHQQHMQICQHVQALENARSELAAVLENMREGMILLDKRRTILSMNESAGRLFGTDPRSVIGCSLVRINRNADLQDLVQAALDDKGGSMAMERNGRHYRIYASPVVKDNAVRGVVLLAPDVTESHAAEESRREFTANVSHELKTPLTSISGFAEIIRDGIAQPGDIRHFAGMICRESARLIALVNDILELSQLDEKQSMGRMEAIALKPMLQGLVSDFSIAAEKKGLSLSLTGHDGEIEGYPLLLREMFFNLLDNAVKYTPEGGKVGVSIESTNGRICCRISDTGIGIPKEHQPHIFERFYRVDKSHSRATGGTGLGLAIVKHVAHIHHGQLTLNSTEGKGTEITLEFEGRKD